MTTHVLCHSFRHSCSGPPGISHNRKLPLKVSLCVFRLLSHTGLLTFGQHVSLYHFQHDPGLALSTPAPPVIVQKFRFILSKSSVTAFLNFLGPPPLLRFLNRLLNRPGQQPPQLLSSGLSGPRRKHSQPAETGPAACHLVTSGSFPRASPARTGASLRSSQEEVLGAHILMHTPPSGTSQAVRERYVQRRQPRKTETPATCWGMWCQEQETAGKERPRTLKPSGPRLNSKAHNSLPMTMHKLLHFTHLSFLICKVGDYTRARLLWNLRHFGCRTLKPVPATHQVLHNGSDQHYP